MNEFLGLEPGFPSDLPESLSLVIARKRQTVLLGRKARGFGKGNLVLPGGKDQYYLDGEGMALVPGEEGAAREFGQETGIYLPSAAFQQRGVLFVNGRDEREVKVYSATVPDLGEPQDSDELQELHWYLDHALPYTEMPADYRQWLPHIMAGYAITAFLDTNESEQIVGGNIFRQKLDPLGRLEQIPISASETITFST